MKQLHAGRLYWPSIFAKSAAYPPLAEHARTTVAIVGGGLSGMVCAYRFARSGFDTVLVEQNEVAGGSTAANTGLIQFGNDKLMTELSAQIGPCQAERFYKLCREAVGELGEMVSELPFEVGFQRRSSLYYASTEQHVPKLEKEFAALRRIGFGVEWWPAAQIASAFGFRKPGAIMAHGDAEINPYAFVHGMAQAAVERWGLRLYEGTDIVRHEEGTGGLQRLVAGSGHSIEADYVVYAVGYEPEQLRIKLLKANLNRSYVIVTGVQRQEEPWPNSCLIWESARPYLYLRTTPDRRIIIGGLDEDQGTPAQGSNARRRHSERLARELLKLFPRANADIAYEWNGTFGESRDNLPFIGEDPERRNVFYCLGYGGNGTVYSLLGAKIITQMIAGRQNGQAVPHPLPFCDIR